MKNDIKKYVGLMICIFAVFLGVRYWDGFIRIIATAIGAATPLLVGCVIAYAVNILMSCYEKHFFLKTKCKNIINGKRPICMFLAFLSLIAIVTLMIVLVVPELINCATCVIESVPAATTAFINALAENDALNQYAAELESVMPTNWVEVQEQFGDTLKSLVSGFGGVMTSVASAVSSIFSGIVTLLVALIFSIYLLIEKEKLCWQANRVLNTYLPNQAKRITYVVRTFDECFHHFIVGQCTEAVILGSMCVLGMALLQLPYALMVGVLIGFTALIPIAGAYIGAGVGAFMILTVSPVKALVFLIFIVILQQVEGNVIYPRVVGKSIGLPGMWVLAAITVGGGLMGVVGMLVAVPIVAAVYHLLQTDIRKRNHEL